MLASTLLPKDLDSLKRYYKLIRLLYKIQPKKVISYNISSASTGNEKYYPFTILSLLLTYINKIAFIDFISYKTGDDIKKGLIVTSSRSSTTALKGFISTAIRVHYLHINEVERTALTNGKLGNFDVIFTSCLTFKVVYDLMRKGMLSSKYIIIGGEPPYPYYRKRLLEFYSKDDIFWAYCGAELGCFGINVLPMAVKDMYVFQPYYAKYYIKTDDNKIIQIPFVDRVIEGRLYSYPYIAYLNKLVDIKDYLRYYPPKDGDRYFGIIEYIDRITDKIRFCIGNECYYVDYDPKWHLYYACRLSYSSKDIQGSDFLVVNYDKEVYLIVEKEIDTSCIEEGNKPVKVIVNKRLINAVRGTVLGKTVKYIRTNSKELIDKLLNY